MQTNRESVETRNQSDSGEHEQGRDTREKHKEQRQTGKQKEEHMDGRKGGLTRQRGI